jgi:5-methylthioadenosine/S-adenosylhomocysteine deaminase
MSRRRASQTECARLSRGSSTCSAASLRINRPSKSGAEPERQLDLIGHFDLQGAATATRVPLALGPSAPERCSTSVMPRTIEIARRYDIPFHSHLYESRGMALQGADHSGCRYTGPVSFLVHKAT